MVKGKVAERQNPDRRSVYLRRQYLQLGFLTLCILLADAREARSITRFRAKVVQVLVAE